MRILFLGDIMGRSGREAVAKHLPRLRELLKTDVVIANGENATHGAGISPDCCAELYGYGVDCITTGNHVWDKREIIPYIDRDPKLLRPMNYPAGTPGKGHYIHQLSDGRKILIVNAMGRLFMDPLDDPFAAMETMLKSHALKLNVNAIFVDFHAETTSEKMAFAHCFDGRVSAVVGSHTHIPTADAHVLAGGTAFQADAGMCGDYDSVIGVRKDIPILRFTRKMPTEKMSPADGEATLCGIFIETDDSTGRARAIDRVQMGGILREYIPDV